MNETQISVGIAGAGIMGRLLALRLQNAGYQVTLFDRDPMAHGSAAAYTAAGMLAPYTELESAESRIYELGQRSLELWPDIVTQLGATDAFYSGGSLVVAHGQDAPDLEHFNQLLARKLPDTPGIEFLDREGLAALEPELAPQFPRATFLQGESWVYTEASMAALARTLLAGGASWQANTEVVGLDAQCIHTAEGEHPFNLVADCRGLGAKQALPELRGVRGEVIEVHAPEVNITRMVRLMHPRYRLYLVPRADHHYVLGATQIESDDTSAISVRSALELLSALYAIHPAFAEARIVETRANCRPALLDNEPLIRLRDGVLEVNGLYRHGYLLAPALAEQAEQLLAAAIPPVRQAI